MWQLEYTKQFLGDRTFPNRANLTPLPPFPTREGGNFISLPSQGRDDFDFSQSQGEVSHNGKDKKPISIQTL